ncbi:SH3 domain-containing protein [Variovorax paradoxus]|nr:SH3 domain-containing protein [Variovorax paradoxus]
MNKLVQRWLAIGAVALVLPVAAAAQEAFARGAVNLRAGPSGDYPLVARLGPGQPFEVLGCTQGYGWCDVVLPDGLRGWVWAGNIDYAYDDRRVPLATYGAMIGVPIVGFTIGNYWSNHYRDRPWYDERRWWGDRPPPPPSAGWRPMPPPRPDWRPNPWRDPGYAHPGPGFRPQPYPQYQPPPQPQPQPGWRTPPGQHPPQDHGVRPPRPEHGVRPPPDARPPIAQPGGRPPGVQPGAVPRAQLPGAEARQRQLDRINRPPSDQPP